MSAVTVNDLNNAKLDVDHIAAITSSKEFTATDRLGQTKKTLAGKDADINVGAASILAKSTAQAADALATRTAIDNRYRGALSADPATRTDGTANVVGDEVFNSTAGLLKRWNGSIWLASDLNTANLAAPGGAALVGYIAGAAGAVARTLQATQRETISVKDFGAVGDGVTSDTAAFNSAIAYANAIGGNDAANITGTTIAIPDGRYKITSALNPITKSGVEFVGLSRSGAVLLLPVGFTAFTWGDGGVTANVVGGGMHSCKLEYLTAPTLPTVAIRADQASRLSFSNLILVNVATLLSLGVSSSRIAGGATLTNVTGYMANIGLPLIDLRFGAGLLMSDMAVFVGGVTHPTHPASMTTVANNSVINALVGFWDTVQISNCLFERFYTGLNIAAGPGMTYQNFFLSNCIFDYIRGSSIYAVTTGGTLSTIVTDANCWFVTWEEAAIYITSSGGYNDNHNIRGVVPIAGKEALFYNITAKACSFSLKVGQVNRLGAVAAALNFNGVSSGFTATGCDGNGDGAAVGLPWRADWGIQTGANCNNYLIANNAMLGAAGGYNHVANTTTSKNRISRGNLYANYAVTANMTAPASGVRYNNQTPHTINLQFFGGTITGGYDKNNVGFPGALQYLSMALEPGDSFSVGYSVAPSIVYSVCA